uniref:Uncharacterized protein n=1 Tax=Plectus sambesii TaxID=2011161 RepID=A0A914X781_9BILA
MYETAGVGEARADCPSHNYFVGALVNSLNRYLPLTAASARAPIIHRQTPLILFHWRGRRGLSLLAAVLAAPVPQDDSEPNNDSKEASSPVEGTEDKQEVL